MLKIVVGGWRIEQSGPIRVASASARPARFTIARQTRRRQNATRRKREVVVRRYIAGLSSRAEFTIVILVAFGWFICASLSTLFSPSMDTRIAEADLRTLLVYELIVLASLVGFLRIGDGPQKASDFDRTSETPSSGLDW